MSHLVTPLTLPSSPELDSLVERLFGALVELLPLDRAAFCRVCAADEVELIGFCPPTAPTPPAGTRIRFGDALGAEAVLAGLAVEVDLAESSLPFDRVLQSAGFRYVLRVPIGRDGTAAAVLAVVRRKDRFAEAEVEAVAALAQSHAGEILDLAHAG